MDHKLSKKDSQNINQSSEKQIAPLENAEKINYTLFDISNTINSTYTLKELYQSIYNSLNKLMHLPNFLIAMYDRKNKIINFDYFIDEYDDDLPIINTVEEPNCLTGEVIITKRPLFLKENALLDRAKKNKLVGSLPKIWLGIPIIIQDKAIGAICVQDYKDPNYFTHKHLEILVCVADQLAIAIERKQIFDTLEKKEQTIQNQKMDSMGTLDGRQKGHITSTLITSKRAAKLIKQLQTFTKSTNP
jgi:transcriptional regulator with GAF, ATPase, and Fis domain